MFKKKALLCPTHIYTPRCSQTKHSYMLSDSAHSGTHLHTSAHTHTVHKRITKIILTAGSGIDLREGSVFCSGNYLDKPLRIWISKSQGNKKMAELLCIKIETKRGGRGRKERKPSRMGAAKNQGGRERQRAF